MRALIVDDARAMRLILRQILHKLGFEVAEAAHGREALDRLRQRDVGAPDVVLVDCQMPEMDGFALVEAVRADPDLRGLRVIMVTGEEEAAQAARALAAGAD